MNPYSRHKARKLAVQAIYQWHMTQDPIDHVIAQFLLEANPKKIDLEYFADIVNGVVNHTAELDQNMQVFLDRKVHETDVVELAVLRLAVYELLHKFDVPFKVVIDEALELAKIYGSVEGFKYVNGILDKVAKVLRHEEFKTKKTAVKSQVTKQVTKKTTSKHETKPVRKKRVIKSA